MSAEIPDRDNRPTLIDRVRAIGSFWLVVVVSAFGLCGVAALRVATVDPTIARAGSMMPLVIAAFMCLLGGVAIGAALDLAAGTVGRAGRAVRARIGRDRQVGSTGESDADDRVASTIALLMLAGTWAAFKWLDIPLSIPAGAPDEMRAASVPAISATGARYLLPLSIGLGLDAVLALWRILAGESVRRRIGRTLLHLGWLGLAVAMITGPNLLAGDPLEWASRLAPARMSVDWLQAATHRVGTIWPAIQLYLVLWMARHAIAAVEEIRALFRLRRAD